MITSKAVGTSSSPRIQSALGLVVTVLLFAVSNSAAAIPLFNRQTGQNCVACHAGGQFPELTPYGRLFKMTGYTIGQRTIPLSVMAVASYSKVADTSKSDDPSADFQKNASLIAPTASLFLAGVFPGLLFGICLIGLVLWTAHKRNMPKSEPIPLKDVPRIVLEALWGLITIVIIMGGILSGVFTPTESAAVACVYAFLVTFFVYRDYKWGDLPHLVHRVVKTVAMVMMLIGFSVGFGYMMALMQIPAKVTMFFLSISENKYVFLFLINILLLLLGTFMDLAPMLLICTPIFLPVILKLGIDPVHFGMIMILNLGIGLITPPVGPTLFVGCAIGKVTIEQVTKELWPFYGAMCIALLLVTYIPAISLWLPGLMK